VFRHLLATSAVFFAVSAAAYGQAKPAKPVEPAQPAAAPSEKETQSLNLTAYAELLRSDIRTQKIAIITEVMGFTEAEDAAFWPIYREYDKEMSALGDERVAMIADYAQHYNDLTDAVADKLALKALDLQSRRQAAEARFYDRIKKALPPKTALRALQVEHQLLLLIDLQIVSSLPVASK